MFQALFFLCVILLVFFVLALISVGLCLGIAHLIIYFSPTLDLVSVLVPAAILTILVWYTYIRMFSFFAALPTHEDDDDDDDEDDYHEPIITRIYPRINKKKRR